MNVLRLFPSIFAALAVALLFHAPMAAAQIQREEIRIVFPSLWNDTLDPILTSGAGTLGLAAIYDDLVGANHWRLGTPRFNTRCSRALPRCRTDAPQLQAVAPGHVVRCHLYDNAATGTS